MTAQGSKKHSEFLTYFLYKLGRLKFVIIASFILAFFTYPFSTIILDRLTAAKLDDMFSVPPVGGGKSETYLVMRQLEGTYTISLMICYLCIAALGIIAFWTIKDSFRYLGSKKYLSMDMSLPVSHRNRFIADALASFSVTFVPCVLAAAIALAVMAHTGTLDFRDDDITRNWAMSECDTTGKRMVMLIFVYLLMYALSLFCMSFCGRSIECVTVPVLMNAAIPASIMFIYETAVSACYGATQNAAALVDFAPLAVTSPLGFMWNYMGKPIEPYIYVLAAIYAAALVIGSYFVQKHRRNERVGNAFVFRYARPVVLGISVLAITAFFTWKLFPAQSPELRAYQKVENVSPGLFIALLIASTLVFYVAGELICGEDIKKLPKILIKYAVTAGACLLICSLSTLTGGFGYSGYIPPAGKVSKVNVSYWDYGDFISSGNVSYNDAAAVHKKIIESGFRPDYDDPDAEYASLNLTYLDENDRYIDERNYYITDEYTEEIYKMCMEGGVEQYSYIIAGDREFTDNNPDCYVFIFDDSGLGELQNEIRTDITFDELQAAFDADKTKLTYERLYKSVYEPGVNLYVKTGNASAGISNQGFEIFPFFDNTLSLLREHGIELFDHRQEMAAAYLIKATNDQGSAESIMSGALLMQPYNKDKMQLRAVEVGSPEFEELWNDIADKTMYSSYNDRYWLCVIYASRYSPDGADPRDSFYAEYYPVVEEYAPRAAELFGSLREATYEEYYNTLNPEETEQ